MPIDGIGSVPFETFEWDEQKRQSNLELHEIDFVDAQQAFAKPTLRRQSDRSDEIRYLVIGLPDGIEIAIAYTVRNSTCRIISTRRASRNERAAYQKAFGDGPEDGQD